MGHQRIGVLPTTRSWRKVVELIARGANVEVIAAATSAAAEKTLRKSSADPTVRRSYFLLARVPLAARSEDFVGELRRLGLDVDDRPTLLSLSAALLDAADNAGRRRGGSDIGEIAALSAAASLQTIAQRSLVDLFGDRSDSPEDTKKAVGGLATEKQFGILARDFFARLVRRLLDYFLSRELPQHVGVSQRFSSLREIQAFDEALDVHCREAAHIVTRFAGQWQPKANFEGGITEAKAGGFLHHAFRKIASELRVRAATSD